MPWREVEIDQVKYVVCSTVGGGEISFLILLF
jgi:hypothetical protein